MIFGLFKDKEDEDFARQLAREVSRRLPPAVLASQKASGTKMDRTLARALDHVSAATVEYNGRKRVGVMKRVRLSKVFQEELDTLGYDDEFIRDVTLRLAQAFTVKKK
jgi:hypothetical protein